MGRGPQWYDGRTLSSYQLARVRRADAWHFSRPTRKNSTRKKRHHPHQRVKAAIGQIAALPAQQTSPPLKRHVIGRVRIFHELRHTLLRACFVELDLELVAFDLHHLAVAEFLVEDAVADGEG